MAKIQFKGYADKHEGKGPWEITEPHRRQKDGEWVTEARTFHRVWLPKGTETVPTDTLLEVVGTQKTQVYEKDGQKKYSLIVYADSVAPVESRQSEVQTPDVWNAPSYNDESPF